MITKFALIVLVVIDQMRTDQLLRYLDNLDKDGLPKLVKQGIFYEDAHHTNFYNVTCPGHVEISTGAQAGLSGVVSNFTYNRDTQKKMYCLEDGDYKYVGADEDNKNPHIGTSPRNILVSTFSDEAKIIWEKGSKSVAIAVKDRSAIALAGHNPDGVFFFADKARKWTTSTYYQNENQPLPTFVQKMNEQVARLNYPKDKKYKGLEQSVPQAVTLALDAAKFYNLGKSAHPDFLSLSISTHDEIAHNQGPDSAELQNILKVESRELARYFRELQKILGNKKMLVVLTSDHGGGPLTSSAAREKVSSGVGFFDKTFGPLNDCVRKKGFDAKPNPVVYINDAYSLFLSPSLHKNEKAEIAARDCLLENKDSIHSAYTRTEILSDRFPKTDWTKNLAGNFHPRLGADVMTVMNPLWFSDDSTDVSLASHQTPFAYDTQVPVIFWGPGLKPQKVSRPVKVTSIAPTISRIVGVQRPSGSHADLLEEVLK